VGRPDIKGRLEVLKVHTKKVPVDPTVDLEVVARGTPGFSGADLENMVNEAALLAAREGAEKVTMQHIEKAKDKVMMGSERRSMIITEDEKEVTAYHEAGHTLVALMLDGTDPVHKVSIIPRGRALGVTQYLPTEEKHTQSKTYLTNLLSCLLGGRLAEELIFTDITTGAGNDLERATTIARKMVCEWGMSAAMGPLTFGKKEEQIFLGREIAQHRDFSEQTAISIDVEVRKLVVTANDTAKKVMSDNLETLKLLARTLLEKETINQYDINEVLKATGCQIPPINRKRLDQALAEPGASVTEGGVIAPPVFTAEKEQSDTPDSPVE